MGLYHSSFAQDSSQFSRARKNNISILFPVYLRNGSDLRNNQLKLFLLGASFERSISSKWSLGSSFSTKFKESNYGRNICVRPELRYYFSGKKFLNGWYTGLLTSIYFQNAKLETKYPLLLPDGTIQNATRGVNQELSLNVMLGYQQVYSNGFSLNAGLGYGPQYNRSKLIFENSERPWQRYGKKFDTILYLKVGYSF